MFHPVCPPLQIEEENAALLAALTDSLDGMVDAEVGGLSVFPALGEEPNQEEEEDDSLPLSAEDFSQTLKAETEDLSLVRTIPYSSVGAVLMWGVLPLIFIFRGNDDDDDLEIKSVFICG